MFDPAKRNRYAEKNHLISSRSQEATSCDTAPTKKGPFSEGYGSCGIVQPLLGLDEGDPIVEHGSSADWQAVICRMMQNKDMMAKYYLKKTQICLADFLPVQRSIPLCAARGKMTSLPKVVIHPELRRRDSK